ncbi:MAG: hypothetical protein IJA17_10410 [Oscillospiraceae bacterium]|nr:hypothetical protein [Oscillospiraceae bacterium]
MYLLDVATGPMYAVIGGTFLLIAAAVAGIVFGAVVLIRKVIENKEDKK